MNTITRNSIIAVTMFSVVYIFNFLRPELIVYSVAAFIVLLLASSKFLFGLTLERDSLITNGKFVLLPLIFNISALSYISYLYTDVSRLLLTSLGILSNFYLLVALRRVRNLGERAAIFYRNVLIMMTFLSVFMSSAMLFRLLMATSSFAYIAFVRTAVVLTIFLLIYFSTYFLSWEKGALETKDRAYGLVAAFLVAQVAWVSSIWSINYPVLGVTERATLGGTPIGAIIITLTFYFLWGIISHKLDKNLNRKVLTEYILFTAVFFFILLATAKWAA